jgi:hypothetical protein
MNRLVHFLLLLILMSNQLVGQVTKVTYDLRFNGKNYDAYLIILNGETIQPKDRIQFNAQISIIVPSGLSVDVSSSHMPLYDNISYNGKKPLRWEISNELFNVQSLGGKSIYSIKPNFNKTAFYNDLHEGDSIKLFTLDVTPTPRNPADVRLYKNGEDATSKKMQGNNFSNGFTLGGVDQLYQTVTDQVTAEPNAKALPKFSTRVYPNPALDYFNLEINMPTEGQVNMELYDIGGKLVKRNLFIKSISGIQTEKINLDLPNGLYNVIITSQGYRTQHKLIVGQVGVSKQDTTGLHSYWMMLGSFRYLVLGLMLLILMYKIYRKTLPSK